MKYIILVERLDTTPDGTGIKQTQAYEYVEGERPEETLKRITGFVAICQCGKIVGAMDFTRTPIKDAGKILGQWIGEGCIVEPRFTSSWSANIESCSCRAAERGEG